MNLRLVLHGLWFYLCATFSFSTNQFYKPHGFILVNILLDLLVCDGRRVPERRVPATSLKATAPTRQIPDGFRGARNTPLEALTPKVSKDSRWVHPHKPQMSGTEDRSTHSTKRRD